MSSPTVQRQLTKYAKCQFVLQPNSVRLASYAGQKFLAAGSTINHNLRGICSCPEPYTAYRVWVGHHHSWILHSTTVMVSSLENALWLCKALASWDRGQNNQELLEGDSR